MTEQLPIDKKTGEPLSPVQKRRVPKKTKEAFKLRIEKGLNWSECAAIVGVAPSTLFKALKQPHCKLLFEQMLGEYVSDIESLEKAHKAKALEVARELLGKDKPAAVRARMVEFLRGEGKKSPSVAVQINNNPAPDGYEFVRPGQQVVVIHDGSDPQDVVSDTGEKSE